ncbi:MAG: hypothetical protein IKQ92_12495 [Clostridia bacterium]|nr:hypothetical protein [Clostridia bacterium]
MRSARISAFILAALLLLSGCSRIVPKTPGGTGTPGQNAVETDPAQPQPAETEPPETEPVETTPPETEPPETELPETEPAETEPAETEPPETIPPETEPPETEPPETEPPETEPPLPENTTVYTREEFFEPYGDDLYRLAVGFVPHEVSGISNGKLLMARGDMEDMTRESLALVDLENCAVTTGEYVCPDSEGEAWNYEEHGYRAYQNIEHYVLSGVPVIYENTGFRFTTYTNGLSEPRVIEAAEYRADFFIQLTDSDLISAEAPAGGSFKLVHAEEDGNLTFSEFTVDLPFEETYTASVLSPIGDDRFLTVIYDETGWEVAAYAICCLDGSFQIFGEPGHWLSYVTAGDRLLFYEWSGSTAEIYSADMPNAKLTFECPEDSYPLRPTGNARWLYFERYEGEGEGVTLFRYDPLTGSCVGSIYVPAESVAYSYLYGTVEYGDTLIFMRPGNDDDDVMLAWQPENAAVTEPGVFSTLLKQIPQGGGYSPLVSDLYEKYGISVYVGEEAVRYFPDYAVLPVTDEKQITTALEALSHYFSTMPDGFVREVAECFSSLDICLTGKIIPQSGNRDAISDAAAFTNNIDGLEYAVFDITLGDFEVTAAHEFFHILESAVYTKAWDAYGNYVDHEGFARWEMLNPDGFDYHWVYTDESGATHTSGEQTGQNWYPGADPDGVYFVDGYSMTYPSEDRARVFENISTKFGDDLPGYFAGIHMKLKAAYLAVCIRDAFDSITDDVHPVWEIAPEYDLKYFHDNYDLDAFWAQFAAG